MRKEFNKDFKYSIRKFAVGAASVAVAATLSVSAAHQVDAAEGSATPEEAAQAAEAALKKDELNNSYSVTQGADGKYYYTLSIEAATPENSTAKEETPAEENNEEGYATEAAAAKAAEEDLKDDAVNKSYSVSQGANGKYFYALSPEEKSAKPAEENNETGYATEAAAVKAAEEDLEDDAVNNSYSVSQGANGKYFYVLSPKAAETPGEKPELTDEEQNENGYATEEAAVKAAEEALKDDAVNNSYSVSQGANGKYYYVLSPKAGETPEEKPAAEENNETGYATEAAATKAAEEALKDDAVNKSYSVSQGANGKYFYVLSPKEAEKPSEEKPSEEKPSEEKPAEENNETGFATKEAAEKAAEEALKNDPVNNSYTVSQGADDKYYYVLSPAEAEKPADKPSEEKPADKPSEEKPSEEKPADKPSEEKPADKPSEDKDSADAKYDKDATEKTFDFDKGFKTKEEAIKQAEALVKNSKINKGYNVSKGADGKYYIQLTPQANKTEGVERKEIKPAGKTDKKDEKGTKVVAVPSKKAKEAKAKSAKGLPQTGAAVAGLGLGAAAIVAGLGLAVNGKKEDQ